MYIDKEFTHVVQINWGINNWNELCANVIEVFGLPGGKYHTSSSTDALIFMFKSKKDKDLCNILLSEHL